MNHLLHRRIDSPVGPIELETDGSVLTALTLCGHGSRNRNFGGDDSILLDQAEEQLREYFAGNRKKFDVPVRPAGTSFQQRVWRELSSIPFGSSRTYGDIAARLNMPRAARAVGGAVGANPLAVIIPCHRVLASDRRLTGFSGGDGVSTKTVLLDLEGIEYHA